jgi:hypothetical protein
VSTSNSNCPLCSPTAVGEKTRLTLQDEDGDRNAGQSLLVITKLLFVTLVLRISTSIPVLLFVRVAVCGELDASTVTCPKFIEAGVRLAPKVCALSSAPQSGKSVKNRHARMNTTALAENLQCGNDRLFIMLLPLSPVLLMGCF